MTLVLPYGPYAGVNGPLLRMAAAKLADMGSATLYDLAVVLGVSVLEARPTWDQLLAEGFILSAQGRARPTERMHELARARFGKPLPRKKAESLVKKAVAAARALNALPSDAPFYWVTRVAVFGSFLDEQKTELGDLDLAWEVEERPGVEDHVMTAIAYNRDSLQSTRAKIFPKGPYVRVSGYREMLALNCGYEILYTFESEDVIKVRDDRVKKISDFQKQMSDLISGISEL